LLLSSIFKLILFLFNSYKKIYNIKIKLEKNFFGDWGLGIGDWGLGIGPNPQSPIPK